MKKKQPNSSDEEEKKEQKPRQPKYIQKTQKSKKQKKKTRGHGKGEAYQEEPKEDEWQDGDLALTEIHFLTETQDQRTGQMPFTENTNQRQTATNQPTATVEGDNSLQTATICMQPVQPPSE